MPELPDLLYVQARLKEALVGRRVSAERVREPIVLRFAVRGNLSLLLGRRLDGVLRHGHFLVFRFEDLDLAVNPMLAGRFSLAKPTDKEERDVCFALTFEMQPAAEAVTPGTPTGDRPMSVLRYRDDKKMGKAYLIAAGDWKGIPGMEGGGLDVLSPEFTRERFVSLLKHRRDQVRLFLLDKKAIDALGNAYADEVLFAAGIHPKTMCRSLSHDDAVRLHDAIVSVMREAVDEVAARGESIDVKVRDFLKIRLREICPRCGSRVRRAGVRGMDAYFCPKCQPARRPGFVDWTKTGL
jgi:formamidopyrimidine-DNA glycosylase